MTSLAALIIGLAQPGLAQVKNSAATERIGVYDSRAIAVAYAGSPVFQKEMQSVMTEHKKAKQAGDQEKAAKIDAEMRARQKKAHLQGFSTAPVDDLLATIKNALPEIQKTAGVSALVSRWDEAGLKKYSGAEQVDVTMKLVDAFQPNERQRKYALEIQKQKPISLEEARKIQD